MGTKEKKFSVGGSGRPEKNKKKTPKPALTLGGREGGNAPTHGKRL